MNLQISRRTLLAGAACAALPAMAQDSLKGWFDRAMKLEPAAARKLLAGVDPSNLSADERQDLRIVLIGLERQAELRQLFPTDGTSPYVVNPRRNALSDADFERMQSEAARGVVPPIFMIDQLLERPDLQRHAETLRQLRAIAKPGDGVWRLPGGEHYFALRLDGSPDESHRRCSDAIHALSARAEAILRNQGLSRGTLGDRFRAFLKRPDLLFRSDQEAVAAMNAAIDRFRLKAFEQFRSGTDISGKVEVMDPPGKRGYRDFDRMVYFPDLHDLPARPSWTLTTVAYHETLPGHLLQYPFQRVAAPHPLRLRFAPGYAEGWAIYAESLADDMGLLGPLEQLGYLQSMLYRLVRVTADIEIHARRASREQAVKSYADLIGFELIFPFAVDVDRSCIEPAGFAADALTMLEIRRLKQGDPREFHYAILRRGPLPISELAAI
jgi:uncharacterized protein (DUF885 family)